MIKYPTLKIVIILQICMLLLISCQNYEDENSYLIEERGNSISAGLTKKNLSQYKDIISKVTSDELKIINVNSEGGITSEALKIGGLLELYSISIAIDKECLSNCAEILLPSAKRVVFLNDPLIGFHGNILSYQHYVTLLATENIEFCNWLYANAHRDLLKRKNMNALFWEEQFLRLKPDVELVYPAEKCPRRTYNFENHMWLPTSDQLRLLFKLEFEGSVCADNPRLCKKRIDHKWKKGTRIVIGDEVYISKGKK